MLIFVVIYEYPTPVQEKPVPIFQEWGYIFFERYPIIFYIYRISSKVNGTHPWC